MKKVVRTFIVYSDLIDDDAFVGFYQYEDSIKHCLDSCQTSILQPMGPNGKYAIIRTYVLAINTFNGRDKK